MEYSKQNMGFPFNICEVATPVTWLILYDSRSLSYGCASPFLLTQLSHSL